MAQKWPKWPKMGHKFSWGCISPQNGQFFTFCFKLGKLIRFLQAQDSLTTNTTTTSILRDVCQKKCGNFSQVGDPPPPSLGTPCLWKQILVYFAFSDIRNIFGFHKNFHFLVVLCLVEVGTGDHPLPLKQKIPTLSRFVKFLYRMSTRGPKTKLT